MDLEQKMDGVVALPGKPHEIQDLPTFHAGWFVDAKNLQDTISDFNRNKDALHLKALLAVLKTWQHENPDAFCHGNGSKLMVVITEILKGKTKRDLCNEIDAVAFHSNLAHRIDSEPIWQPDDQEFLRFPTLPLPTQTGGFPSPLLQNVQIVVTLFNRNPSLRKDLFSHLVKNLQTWIDERPDEFLAWKGQFLFKTIQAYALQSIAGKSCQRLASQYQTEQFSENLITLRGKIKAFNHSKTLWICKRFINN